MMRVIPEVSSVAATTISLGNGVTATQFNVEHFETTVSARDGETVAIGGLIQKRDTKNENKYPWLGDLPYVGTLFRYRTQDKTKTELLVILTPHIVRNPLDADRILAEEARRMDWVLGDVLKTQGASGMAPILPPPPSAAGAGMVHDPISDSPLFGIPAPGDLLPCPVATEPSSREALPQLRKVPPARPPEQPQAPPSTRPMSQSQIPSGIPASGTAAQPPLSIGDPTATPNSAPPHLATPEPQVGQSVNGDSPTPPDLLKENRGWSLFPSRK